VSHSTRYSSRADLRRPENMSDSLRQALRILLAAETTSRPCYTQRVNDPARGVIAGNAGTALHRRGYATRQVRRGLGTLIRLTDDGRAAARALSISMEDTNG